MERTVNILVVDDEQIVLDSVKRLLRKTDCNLFFALSVKEGFEIIEKERIHFILTDLMMPEIDGLEFMKIVNEKYPAIPIIMITGYATINTALQATQLGAFDYIAKPFSKKELLGVVQRATDIVLDADNGENNPDRSIEQLNNGSRLIQSSGEYSWMILEKDGHIRLGIRDAFVSVVGEIKSVYLPSAGDELRQGGSFIQVVSGNKRSFSILSPLSGTVTEVNEKVIKEPSLAAADPFGEGWMIRLKPTRLEAELKFLGY